MKSKIQNTLYIFFLLIVAVSFTACGDKPDTKLKKEQYAAIDKHIKEILGGEFVATNFTAVEEGYSNDEKTRYVIKLKFDLNKPFLIYDGKGVKGEIVFEKKASGWECIVNSAATERIFDLLQVN